jgi:hypothetical protein
MRCCRRAQPPPGSMLRRPCTYRAPPPLHLPRAAAPIPRAVRLLALRRCRAPRSVRRRRAPAPRAAALAPRAGGSLLSAPPSSLLCTAAGLHAPCTAAGPAPRAAIPASRPTSLHRVPPFLLRRRPPPAAHAPVSGHGGVIRGRRRICQVVPSKIYKKNPNS